MSHEPAQVGKLRGRFNLKGPPAAIQVDQQTKEVRFQVELLNIFASSGESVGDFAVQQNDWLRNR